MDVVFLLLLAGVICFARELPDGSSVIEFREETPNFLPSLHSIDIPSAVIQRGSDGSSSCHVSAGNADLQGENSSLKEIVIQDGAGGRSPGKEVPTEISNSEDSPQYLKFDGGQVASHDLKLSGNAREAEMCSICLNSIPSTQDPVFYFGQECRHNFCNECIDNWLNQQRKQATCPVCRCPVEWTKELAAKLPAEELQFDQPCRSMMQIIRSLSREQVAILTALVLFFGILITIGQIVPNMW
ncbi:hypothetical protein PGTUg99_001276 [Puccinia graminis f. sp. tritici]|uniref:RING-type domain-containing protein n=1 Tax=Puccinia graminis f. sp. tritici TaxID=56615 RepID=A0A5B0PA07_PUCGR|nr:hypothetical protein PGTUg99_001276 [Puccinia graminis f. sp. tritici]